MEERALWSPRSDWAAVVQLAKSSSYAIGKAIGRWQRDPLELRLPNASSTRLR
jgi:hypothetical protein